MPEWRSVVGYEGLYEVSDDGRVRSAEARELKQRITVMYPRWIVRLSIDGVRRPHFVHRLVAEAFIGARPDGCEICHTDGDRDNNRADNLRYDSHAANMRDAVGHGTHSMTCKELCPRGHSIRNTWNVRRRGGKVECLSCARAKSLGSYRRRHGITWTDADILRDADQRYASLGPKPKK